MSQQPPKIGDLVYYKLSHRDITEINSKYASNVEFSVFDSAGMIVHDDQEVIMRILIVGEPSYEDMYPIGGELVLQNGVHHVVMVSHEAMSSVTYNGGMWRLPLEPIVLEQAENVLSFDVDADDISSEDLHAALSRIMTPTEQLTATKDMVDRAYGMILAVDEEGEVFGGRLINSVDGIRGMSGNLIVWLDGAHTHRDVKVIGAAIPGTNHVAQVAATVFTKTE